MAAAAAPTSTAAPANTQAMMSNPNMRRMMSSNGMSKPASGDTKPGGNTTTTASTTTTGGTTGTIAAMPAPQSSPKKSPAGPGATTATTTSDAAPLLNTSAPVGPKKPPSFLRILVNYNPADVESYRFWTHVSKQIPDDSALKGKVEIKGEPTGDSCDIFVNKELWFSKKKSKAYPEEKSLMLALSKYLETGTKSEIIVSEGAGCVIA